MKQTHLNTIVRIRQPMLYPYCAIFQIVAHIVKPTDRVVCEIAFSQQLAQPMIIVMNNDNTFYVKSTFQKSQGHLTEHEIAHRVYSQC